MTEKVYTVKQLCEYLSFSERTVLELLKSGEIPARKVTSEWRILESSVIKYLKKFDNIKEE